ncbi:toprim domain-containing protein [Pseudomonas plecoglossicida]|nr:toprim domain-containing protein [Pseudomonas plecoglossicida]
MQAVYGPLDWLPVPDGTIHRFHVHGDKPGTRCGWYVLYLDGIASGAFGSWKVGDTHIWSRRRPTDPLEAQLIAQHIEHAKRQREAEEHQRQQLTAEWAGRWWRDAKRADPAHPYLVAKGIRPHSLRQRGAYLLAPLYLDGHLVTLQQIAPDGSKRFLSGGRVKGCYSPIGVIADDQPLYVCEGFATGATIHEETGAAVACAMSADNLLAVGKYLRRRYPDAVLIFGGDDDRCKEVEGKPNMGKLAAITAAAELGCGLVLPQWPADAPQDLSDFNDLRQWRAKP